MRQHKKFVPIPFEFHQEIDVTIESLSNLGVGIAKVDIPSQENEEETRKWVVFIPLTAPGDKVRARIFRNDNNCSQGELVEILEPSPNRIEPLCELFGKCGGCQYQHINYKTQLEWKTKQVGELLRHMAKIDHPVQPAIASPRPWNYRSKLTPHFHKPKKGRVGSIGFLHNSRRNTIVDVPQCPIAMEEINQALPILRKDVSQKGKQFKSDVTLLMRVSEGMVETNDRAIATEHVGELAFSFLAGDFFQNNPFILPSFTEYVAKHAATHGAKYLVDAYCGSGLFALTLASSFEKVAGVEVSETAADWARANARQNKIENATFKAASAEAIFADIDFPADETAVVIDPPRKGCNEEFLSQLFTFGPSRCVYISCNPSTQMRDLQSFTKAGYVIEEVQPFDLFPQTRHLECVVVLRKK